MIVQLPAGLLKQQELHSGICEIVYGRIRVLSTNWHVAAGRTGSHNVPRGYTGLSLALNITGVVNAVSPTGLVQFPICCDVCSMDSNSINVKI